MKLASAVTRDYLTDARIGKLPFMKLKKFLSDNGVDAKEMSSASTKFALVAIAEKKEIALEPLLDELGPREAIEAPPERVLQRRPTLALTDRGGRPTPLATALTPAAEASTSAAAPAAKEPEKESPSSVVPTEKKEGKKKASPAGARKASSASKTSSPSGARKSSASPAGARKASAAGGSPAGARKRSVSADAAKKGDKKGKSKAPPPPPPEPSPAAAPEWTAAAPEPPKPKPEAKPLGGIKSFREPNGRRASRLVALVSEDQVPAEVHSMVEQTFESVWVSILPFDDPAEAEARGAPAGSAVALDFAFRTTEAPLDAMGAALQKAGALEAEGKMTEAAEVMAGAMEAAAASIQARHRGKLTRQATSQKLAEARMSGVKQ